MEFGESVSVSEVLAASVPRGAMRGAENSKSKREAQGPAESRPVNRVIRRDTADGCAAV